MQNYPYNFVEFALQNKALLFGQYKLNSGRISPYFFNAGCFNTGAALGTLGRFYAEAIIRSGIHFDVLFGPAYKGIPLVSTTAIALFEQYGIDKPYAFNRKQTKDHGEGNLIVGAPLKGKVLIIDDVITSGITIHNVTRIIRDAGAEVAGIVILMDRQERGESELSAVEEVKKNYGISVINVIKLVHVLDYLKDQGNNTQLEQMQDYQRQYGIL